MSQQHSENGESSRHAASDGQRSPPSYARPNYMTVGSGSTSEHADRLAQMLNDNDSGYGSMSSRQPFDATTAGDRPLPDGLNLSSLSSNPSLQFDYYDSNRTRLASAISKTLQTLIQLQKYNQQWPAHYPSTQPPSPLRQQLDSRPNLRQTQSTSGNPQRAPLPRPSPLRRAETSVDENTSHPGPETEQQQTPSNEPRLMTPQLARDFSVLKIDLKVDGLAQTEIIHQMKNSKALAQLLDGQINKSKRHLSLLRERIEDMSSKVLVTGDLNAGKSTFCNALLRRKILPEDEQPCTSIFCEVLRAEDNHHVEEVHAIPLDTTYDLNNERTYEVHPLKALEQIVTHNEKYSQCKIYIKDIRPTHASLLNNKVLEIALIDAPGLNNDSLKTTEIFARQEEIDVVVFVVSAANHFTLSAREFIMDAAREKDFMFMVVNGFDNIKNKERCQEQILRQVANLSPATFKESSELVHFVSSNAVPVASDPGPDGDGGSGGSSQGSIGPDNDPDADRDSDDADEGRKHSSDSEPADPRNKGKERASQQKDFSELEASLRRFVLEKRARSKLAPAKTYLINVLDDLNNLAIVNRDVAQAELERVAQELSTLEPELNQSRATRNEASGNLDHQTEETATEVYSHTRNILNATIAEVSQRDLGLSYPGFWDAYGYAQDLITAMLAEVSSSVGTCEEHAREKTAEGTTNINTLGRQHLDKYNDYTFLSDKMFRRRKDALARQVDIDVDVWDFFDVVGLWERQEKVAGTGMAVTVAGVLGGRLIGGVGWVDGVLGAAKIIGVNNIRRLFIPGVLVGVVLTVGYMITTLPTTLPRRISAKLSSQLHSIDFIHSNALRISSEVRKALKYPADNLRVGLTRNFEDLQNKRTELGKVKGQSDVALKYFSNLVTESGRIGGNVRDVDLEGSNTQGAAIVNGAGDGNIGVTSRM